MREHLFLLVWSVVLLFSCSGGQTSLKREDGDTLRFKYAENITVVKHKGYTVVELADPWSKGKTLHTYVLIPADGNEPEMLSQGTIIRTPLQKCVVGTSSHCALAISLGKEKSIAGVCDLRYINLPWVHELHDKGMITDCGSPVAPTIEKIIDLHPDAIFLSPFQNNGGYGRLEELSVPIIEVADYMETSALGRAEWIRFYGMLLGAEHEADSIFNKVEKSYFELRRLAHKYGVGKSLLMDKLLSAVWYMPGGKSTIGGVIADANIDYPWKADGHSGSLTLTFESVLGKAENADLWLIRYNSEKPMTLASLLSENEGYSQFKAFKEGEVYGCNTAHSTFYEDTPFRPDLLLREFILLAHPDMKELGEAVYFKKIK